jgi:GxxExxY protein
MNNGPQSHRVTEFDEINAITERVIGCGIEVHKALGPGLSESLYETALCIEFDAVKINYKRQCPCAAYYRGRLLGQYRIDLVVEDLVVVEIKSVERTVPVFEAQLLTYMRLLKKRGGLILNFNSRLLKEGITRRVL